MQFYLCCYVAIMQTYATELKLWRIGGVRPTKPAAEEDTTSQLAELLKTEGGKSGAD